MTKSIPKVKQKTIKKSSKVKGYDLILESPERKYDLSEMNFNAAGIDIGAREIVVAVPRDRDQQNVRTFGTFTADLIDIVKWLKECNIDCVAMEATGVYWIPLFDLIKASGIEPFLANPRTTQNVSGRKSDVQDAEWLMILLRYGLISGAFRPSPEFLPLRAYIRQRGLLIEHRSPHILHMDKALILMNLRLSNVISDINGETGIRIIKSILKGERDPKKLAVLRDKKCKNSEEIIELSLQGTYKDEQLFALRQSLEACEFYNRQIEECDREIENVMNNLKDKITPVDIHEMHNEKIKKEEELQLLEGTKQKKTKKTTPKPKRNCSKNKYNFDAWTPLFCKTGVDLTRLPGINEQTALVVISEIGTDMSPWRTEKHISSWAGICPNNKVSGGKRLSGRTKRCSNRLSQALKLAAYSLHSSKSAMGAYYRRMQAKHGSEKAITATAHKLLRLIYRMLKYGMEYVEIGQVNYEKQYKERQLKGLMKKSAELGYTLTPINKIAA